MVDGGVDNVFNFSSHGLSIWHHYPSHGLSWSCQAWEKLEKHDPVARDLMIHCWCSKKDNNIIRNTIAHPDTTKEGTEELLTQDLHDDLQYLFPHVMTYVSDASDVFTQMCLLDYYIYTSTNYQCSSAPIKQPKSNTCFSINCRCSWHSVMIFLCHCMFSSFLVIMLDTLWPCFYFTLIHVSLISTWVNLIDDSCPVLFKPRLVDQPSSLSSL